MTLLVDEKVQYEPTVYDRVQRILYRLDSGEQLGKCGLRVGNNFCVMGLFADESGLGYWTDPKLGPGHRSGYIIEPNPYPVFAFPPSAVVELYRLKCSSGYFEYADLPEELYNEVKALYHIDHRARAIDSLTNINDILRERGYPVAVINDILAKIIRSGAIFK